MDDEAMGYKLFVVCCGYGVVYPICIGMFICEIVELEWGSNAIGMTFDTIPFNVSFNVFL